MRRFKKKGGAQGASQGPSLSTGQSSTISSSISSTYGNAQDIYSSIADYITSNFVFVLVGAILLIFYMYLLSTDPVTQEDLDALIIPVTCSSLTDTTCPEGLIIAGSKACVNNICDTDTCCVDKLNCGTWTECPSGESNQPTNSCIDDKHFKCSNETCCKTNCSSKNFTETTCDADTTYVSTNVCAINNNCLKSDCCVPKRLCSAYNEKGEMYSCDPDTKINPVNKDTACIDGECTQDFCCIDTTSTDTTSTDTTSTDTTSTDTNSTDTTS
jgi:hypothetical protein